MSRFRMTAEAPKVWWKLPDYELKPHLEGGWRGEQLRQEGWDLQSVGGMSKPIRYRLPDPLLPVLLDVDIDSEEDILRLVRAYGPLGVTKDEIDEGLMTYVHNRPEDFDGSGLREHTVAFSEIVEVADQQAAIAALRRAQAIAAELGNDTFNTRALRGLRDPWIWPDPPPTKKAAENQLRWIINAGLSGFELRFKGGQLSLEPPLSLFAIACLELVAAAEKGLPWRRCALDSCKLLFQPNRHDQVFHEVSCARVSASRAYRLRERSKKEKGAG